MPYLSFHSPSCQILTPENGAAPHAPIRIKGQCNGLHCAKKGTCTLRCNMLHTYFTMLHRSIKIYDTDIGKRTKKSNLEDSHSM